ncbi:MAG: sensor histidine kinase [Leptospiraceae bacterium]|nr:sensor histidine kinase [Leptospiraceae bacterium]
MKKFSTFFLIALLNTFLISSIYGEENFIDTKIQNIYENWACINSDSLEFKETEFIPDKTWYKISMPSLFFFKDLNKGQIVWCRTKVQLSSDQNDLGIIVANIINAHEIFWNGHKIGSQGQIAENGDIITPNARPYLYKLNQQKLVLGDNTLALRISDNSLNSGVLQEPMIGEWNSIERYFFIKVSKIISFSIILLFLSIYHLVLYTSNKTDISYLYFALICFFSSFMILGYYKITYWIYPNYTFHFFCQHISLSLINLLIPIFINKMLGYEIGRFAKFLMLIYLLYFLFSLASLFSNKILFFFRSYGIFSTLGVMSLLISFEVFRKAYRAFKENMIEAKIIAFGGIFVSVGIILFSMKIFNLGVRDTYVEETFLFFIFCIAISLAFKMRKAQESIIKKEANYSYQLELQVKEKTEELAKTNKILEESNILKDKLFSVLSHDLRSPLQILDDTIRLFEEKTISKSKLKTYLNDVSLNLKKNRFLLENLLNWSKSSLMENAIEIKENDLSQIIFETILFFDVSTKKKNISLINHFDKDVICVFDTNTIRIVIRNLLSNAIKFTTKEGKIVISFQEKNNGFKICISDNGIGMTNEELLAIQSPRTVVPKTGTEQELGSGIGLQICKEILQKMGTELSIQTEVGKGSEFSFFLRKSL